MRVIYISKTCSSDTFDELYQKSIKKPQQQDQKFHQMLIEGFVQNNIFVEAISSMPINRTNMKKAWFWGRKEKKGPLNYHYLFFINIKILRQVSLMVSLIWILLWMLPKKRKETVIYCDILNLSLSTVTNFMARLFHVNHVAVVTDLPNELEYVSPQFKKRATRVAQKYKGYVLLTESMNSHINPNQKPYIVIEGMIREEMATSPVEKFKPFTFLYAGGLSESSNILVLIKAFLKANLKDSQLIICGDGALSNEVKTFANHTNIQYLGSKPNREVVDLEKKSHILVNPRSKNERQTKFAFPSKIMEYLNSGTPVLSTKLEGIPKEYFDYLYEINDESEQGFIDKLTWLKSLNKSDLNHRGYLGKQFVNTYKTNTLMASKIIAWSATL